MLSSFTGDLAGAPDGHDAFFLVEGFPETLGHAVILQVLENLNVHTKTHTEATSHQTVVRYCLISI